MQDTTKIEEYLNSTLNKLTTLNVSIDKDYGLGLRKIRKWEMIRSYYNTKSIWEIDFDINIEETKRYMNIKIYQDNIVVSQYSFGSDIMAIENNALKTMQFIVNLMNHKDVILEHLNQLVDLDLMEREFQQEEEEKRIRREKEQQEMLKREEEERKQKEEMIRTLESLKGKILYENWTYWNGKKDVIPSCKVINVTEKNVMVIGNTYHEESSMFTPSTRANKRIPIKTFYDNYEKGYWFLKD